jgi:hypothetical protein
MLDGLGEQLTRSFKVVACVKQAINLGAVLGPFLDLVVITVVREQRAIRLFGRFGPKVWHCEQLG